MICEKSNPIPVPKPTTKNNIYSLNNTIFDPNNSSPPNEFMLKLKLRSLIYNDNSSSCMFFPSKEKIIQKGSIDYFSSNLHPSLEKK